jgi:hypothetical protein
MTTRLVRIGCSTYIIGTKEENTPVVIAVAASRPVAVTVDLIVSDGNTTTSLGTENNMLATNKGCRAVVDPNIIGSVKSDSIATPDKVRVKIGNMNVLDDNVLDTIGETKTLTLNNTLRTNTDNALIRANHNRVQAGLVILDVNLASARFVFVAPQVLVDSKLAVSAGSPRSTASLASRTFRVLEVKSTLKVDNTRSVIFQIVDELLVVPRANNLPTFASSGARAETFSLGRQGSKASREKRRNGDESVEHTHCRKIEGWLYKN